MKDKFICNFKSKMNETAKGITYALYDLNEKQYLVKWIIGNNNHEMKYKKSFLDNKIKQGDFVIE